MDTQAAYRISRCECNAHGQLAQQERPTVDRQNTVDAITYHASKSRYNITSINQSCLVRNTLFDERNLANPEIRNRRIFSV